MSDVPYGYIKEECESFSKLYSVGFFKRFETVERYGKTYYRINQYEVESLLGFKFDETYHSDCWMRYALFEKQEESYDIYRPELDTEDEYGYETVRFNRYVVQRTTFENDYHGYIALPMNNGGFWLLYFEC